MVGALFDSLIQRTKSKLEMTKSMKNLVEPKLAESELEITKSMKNLFFKTSSFAHGAMV